jgi:hypothetical protein
VQDLGSTPRHTDWLIVSRNVTLTLTSIISTSCSKSKSHYDRQSVSMSWCQAPIWDPRPISSCRLSWVEFILRPTVSWPIHLGIRPDLYFSSFWTDNYLFFFLWHPLWRENGSVVYSSGYSTYFFTPDPMEMAMVTLGNALLSCLGYEYNESCPGYGRLSIVCHVGTSHRGIDPRFLDLSTNWRCVISFTPQPLYPRGNSPHTHLIECWVGPRAILDGNAPIGTRTPTPTSSSPRAVAIQSALSQLLKIQ